MQVSINMSSFSRTMPIIGATDFHALSRLTLVALDNDFDVGPDLSEKLENSWVLADDQVSLDTVSLGTTVSYDVDGQKRQVTLVLPNELQAEAARLSVLTPVGVALLGLKPGQRGEWNSRDGRRHQLTVVSVDRAAKSRVVVKSAGSQP